MPSTLQVHSGFVTALDRSSVRVKISGFGLLHCDKLSWFCHTEASTVRFVVQALIVSGDNGLGEATTGDEINVRWL
jgi:hypothetical protein